MRSPPLSGHCAITIAVAAPRSLSYPRARPCSTGLGVRRIEHEERRRAPKRRRRRRRRRVVPQSCLVFAEGGRAPLGDTIVSPAPWEQSTGPARRRRSPSPCSVQRDRFKTTLGCQERRWRRREARPVGAHTGASDRWIEECEGVRQRGRLYGAATSVPAPKGVGWSAEQERPGCPAACWSGGVLS